ncbi:solute carrier family 22 member 13-like isoform X2 [Mastacembelus armatus]|uniref:solute carrier family 22 member 13-like isoform X2 n=1 Tax=Mastacembelus armatus TaxID=205130 RepID=UPI000E457B5A|nr:solute carrier family 22 member 13-like isoform X2 [Mastacembelus armatus]
MAEFGEILKNIGEFGLFQKVTLIAVSFPNLIQSFIFASFLFFQPDPERHCNTDWILRADPNLTTAEQLNLTLPREEDGTFSRCRMFVPVDWDIGAIRDYGLNETTVCQDGWVYYNLMYESTIVTDFDLICGKAKLVEVIQTVFMVGVLFGSLIFGPCAESFGRKRATQIPVVILFVFVVTAALSPNIYLYLACQFMVGLGAGAYRINCIILSTEWIGVSKRSWGACVTQLFGAVGQCILAGLVYAVRDWRLAQLITAAPAAVAIIYIWFIPESARWLLGRGRTDEAKQLIIKAAAINKRTVPDSLLDKIAVKDVRHKGGIKIIFKSPVLTKYFFILILAWFSLSLSIYSLYFDMGNLGFNIFMTQLLFGAIEIPALILCMWLLEVFGRKILYIATLLSAGLSCILIIAVPPAATTCGVFTQELFPTSVRQTATALGAISGRIGALLAPLLKFSAIYHWTIPITIFSSLTLVSGALGFMLSETKNKELPDSADEAENRNRGSTNTVTCPIPNSTKL